jgi:ATP-dependent Clp protease ATP-binding subunit ClpC
VEKVFERFTERARQVVVFAQDEARRLGHPHIGTEHLLLGLFREEDGVAAVALRSSGLTLEAVRDDVVRIAGRGEGTPTGQIPFTPRAKRTLELALREAVGLQHNYIGTEHILLALARSPDSMAARVLLDAGADEGTLRGAVLAHIGGKAARSPDRPRPRASAWEYRMEEVGGADEISIEVLNALGADGWELTAALPSDARTQLFFKRRRAS